MLNKIKGIKIFEGPSLINGKKIVSICTGMLQGTASKNVKTGPLIQNWIMYADENPIEAAKTGNDDSVCDSCPHRRGHGQFKSCYVNLGQAPLNVWKSYKKGKYIDFDPKNHLVLFKDRKIRFASYGEPTAMPFDLVEQIAKISGGWLAYTHRWNKPNIDPRWNLLAMASCDNEQEAQLAISKNWRVFYVRKPNDPIPKTFLTCPASIEANKKLQCSDCMICKGFDPKKPRKGNVTILAHGILKKRFNELTIGVTNGQ